MRFDLPMMEDAPITEIGKPRIIALDDIDEDPEQPRQEFDAEALQELAVTIAARGVRQPVSVREHPDRHGRWLLNFGARRFRASRMAGRTDIPAFVDAPFDSYDQIIENEQRQALKPIELALFVKKRLASGESKAEIARRMGKTPGYLTFIGALIDPPDWLLETYRSGRCSGITELYELRRLYEMHGQGIEAWAKARMLVSRTDLAQLRVSLDGVASAGSLKLPNDKPDGARPRRLSADAVRGSALGSTARSRPSMRPVRAPLSAVLWATYQEATVRVDLRSVPEHEGYVYLSTPDGQARLCVPAADVHLVRVSVLTS